MYYKKEHYMFENEINRRGITKLVHFTRLDNLLPIYLQQEIRSRAKIQEILCNPQYKDVTEYFGVRDKLRLDKRTEYVSLSIEHPNYPLFNRKQNDEGGVWCVIEIKPSVLLLHDTLFSIYNAASSFAIKQGIGGTFNDFIKLFQDDIPVETVCGRKYFTRKALRDCYPTTDQAEILVKDAVQFGDVIKFCFKNDADLLNAQYMFVDMIRVQEERGPYIDLNMFTVKSLYWEKERR